MAILEDTLRLISLLVLTAALLGLSAMLLASIRERNREIQLLRVIGAPPGFLFLLIELEALLISAASILLGTGMLTICLMIARDFLAAQFGLHIDVMTISADSFYLLLIVVVSTILAAAIPSLYAYRGAKHLRQ